MEQVSKQKVSFQSEELKVGGNLFKPQNSKNDVLLPAILVAGAMTGVKEQVAGNYGECIAKAGYMTLVLDHRHFGESEGMPRQHEDPAKKMEDFKNAISFLRSLNGVNKERIGACGISMGGGYMLQLSAFDRRIKAVAIVASGLSLGDTLSDMLGKDGFINFIK
jgi:dienelactone hydrolase